MERDVKLPGGALSTSRIGFGGAYLAGGAERAASLRNVAVALDAGYRHFDVAPAYGMGLAEDILGEALKGRRDHVTIATKVGLDRPKSSLKSQVMRFLATPVRRLLPGLTKSLGQKMYQASVTYGRFDLAFVESSFHDSLRRLQTDYVDILHLHEASVDDITPELLTWLDKAKQAGKLRAFGLASQKARVNQILARHGAVFDLVQYSWSIVDTETSEADAYSFRITHRAIMNAYSKIQELFKSDMALVGQLSQQTGIDLGEEDNLSLVLLSAALVNNPGGVVLAGSRKAERIKGNLGALNETYLDGGRRLLNVLENKGLFKEKV